MKITETIDRECCESKDLKQMHSNSRPVGRFWYFCIHCGRHWEEQGGTEPGDGGMVALPWPWEDER